jgi:hypothetical protein
MQYIAYPQGQTKRLPDRASKWFFLLAFFEKATFFEKAKS